ncbi:hypothetical protein QBC35DRAFT_429981 [Podospora australis]|uniref:Tafazzin n=1 Tax=Podospora australis TaxID=1536484 RepID=A0AAN6WXG1_9PEZI|nr:hypothetical protein QBC35DRAFT_429981 [Podospora australis]
MPKKRYQKLYSKPQSTAPSLLSSSSSAANNNNNNNNNNNTVNERLAELRRNHARNTVIDSNNNHGNGHVQLGASVPPVIREILQIPETPPPRPRAGPRPPPGPAPPRSWLSSPSFSSSFSLSTKSPEFNGEGGSLIRRHLQRLEQRLGVSGALGDSRSLPARGSLVDWTLRKFVQGDWEWQRDEYCGHVLYQLPTHLRVALVAYLGVYGGTQGVCLKDLKAIFLPPSKLPVSYDEDGVEEEAGYEYHYEPPAVANQDVWSLDLSGSLGRGLKIRELEDFLFPRQKGLGEEQGGVEESWEDQHESEEDETQVMKLPKALLPNLTHLSLAIDPEYAYHVSWRQLLSFAKHLPNLTHLSLAFWPEPSLTPNAKFASVVSPDGRRLQYGGTGPYSHTLDNDWSEAIMVLTRLSKSLYGLEYLDLTGCGMWTSALWSKAEHDAVDWVGDWGKIETLLLYPGYELDEAAGVADTAKYIETVENARRLERHVRGKRAGKGRFITVETDHEFAG